jgi:predicted sulfurtransferase
MSVINAAAYKFAELTGLPELRERLKAGCRTLGLKGSILLSPEGINLFIAGEPSSVESLLVMIRTIPGLEALEANLSESVEQPFNRMLVKLKQEIIAFGVEGINPARYTSPRLPAKELKRWLDEGRPVTLLDTRNTYEVKLGTFEGALTLPIRHFRKFPEAVDALPTELKEAPIVSFCTGGIRCEKAAPYLERAGFREVYQLEGGILKYFEECGGAHWLGECFVFDKRVGVDPALRETGSQLCFACQEPLTTEELKDPRYVYEVSCPYCFVG